MCSFLQALDTAISEAEKRILERPNETGLQTALDVAQTARKNRFEPIVGDILVM